MAPKTTPHHRAEDLAFAQRLEVARKLFLATDETQAEIARIASISQTTLKKYRDEEGWEDMRRALRVTPTILKQELYKGIEGVTKKYKDEKRTITPAEADTILKLTKAIDLMTQGPTLDVILEVLMGFSRWIAENHFGDAELIAGHLNQYIKQECQRSSKS